MNDKPAFWFPLKTYGWGWGPPVRWQGWAVLAVYALLLVAGIYYSKPPAHSAALLVYMTILTLVLVAVVAATGERPVRWRWGKK